MVNTHDREPLEMGREGTTVHPNAVHSRHFEDSHGVLLVLRSRFERVHRFVLSATGELGGILVEDCEGLGCHFGFFLDVVR